MKPLKKAKNLFYPGSKLDFKPIHFFIENTEVESFYYCDYGIFQNHSIEFIKDEILRQIRPVIDNDHEIQEQPQDDYIDDRWDIDFEANEIDGILELDDFWDVNMDMDMVLDLEEIEDENVTERQDQPRNENLDDYEILIEDETCHDNNNGNTNFNEYSVRYAGSVNPDIFGDLSWSDFFHENSNIIQEQIDSAVIHKFEIYNNYTICQLIYFGTEAIKTYENLLNKLQSIDVVIVDRINLNQHWQTFSQGSLLKQLADKVNKPPRHLLVRDEVEEWEKYERLNNNVSALVRDKLNFNVFYYNGAILLRELLRLTNINRIKFHFIDKDLDNNPAINLIREGLKEELIALNYRNSQNRKLYRVGEVSVGLVRVCPRKNLWLLFHVGVITHDLNVYNEVGYDFKEMTKFDKYVSKLIVKYPLRRQSKIRKAEEVFDDFEVRYVLPSTIDMIDESFFSLFCNN